MIKKIFKKLAYAVWDNWYLISAGLVLTGVCSKIATQQRGYSAVGGEFLILPLILLIGYAVKRIIKSYIKGHKRRI